ncbi:hypothetical protein FSOLCH5_003632 [Fusarium solani]|jgi:pyruvate decarboxylase|uniref:Pyruvate decarboxylase n=1 Tax=Fusarium solani TaxID=169388 RepID=A0A9P9G1E1_FUSSL|nr:thiamine diphosphate-binding protein [Fusarium solani]KAH7231460.1 thiamine diphosphate-binding protein [Fusarium solani]KAJ3459928.1 hypothetical protein MRS44_016001 [Fusarium solani]
MPSAQPHIDLAEYLFRRLAELGLGSIHGVPGDYNLTALDYIEPAGLKWVGNANELNAGYAADGYGRIKGIAAMVTSFGPGELSAVNAIGGAYAEKSPIVHIVGTPALKSQRARQCIHHSLGDGNFKAFSNIYKHITVAQADLEDVHKAPKQIDDVLKQCILQSRPVYVMFPACLVTGKVPPPTDKLDLSIPGYDSLLEDQVVDKVVSRIENAKKPLIIVDGFTYRFGVKKQVNDLVRSTNFPTFTTPFGKGLVDEDMHNFQGVAFGAAGKKAHADRLQASDLVLHFGPLGSEINTFGYTALPNPVNTVTFEKESVRFGNAEKSLQPATSLTSVLNKLLKRILAVKLPVTEPFPEPRASPSLQLQRLPEVKDDTMIDQFSLWLRMSEFLKEGDVVLTETGTSSSGGLDFLLPKNTTIINSSIWLSIGYTLAASQGAALAQREQVKEGTRSHNRTVVFEGDGSLQMTAQSISDMIRNKLNITIFVLNNSGYTVERLIHGFDEIYNDIQPWRNLEAFNYFGAPTDDISYPVRTLSARTWGELWAIIRDPDIQSGKGLTMVEIFVAMDDAPEALKRVIDLLPAKKQQKKE